MSPSVPHTPPVLAHMDAVQELRTAPFNRFHVFLIASIMLATLLDGYDTLNAAYVIAYVSGPWGLNLTTTGFMVSSGLIGFLVGALAHGPIVERIGRRPVLITALVASGILSFLTAVIADSFTSYAVLRFLTGLFLGAILPLSVAYISDFSPARTVNRIVIVAVSGYTLGGVLASVVGIYIVPAHGWQALYWIGSASILLALAVTPFLPESVHFQVMRGDHKGIARTLARVRPDRKDLYEGAVFAQPRKRASTSEVLRTVVAPGYLRTTVCLWICAFMVLFCTYGLSGWLPRFMQGRGNELAASFAFLTTLQVAGIAGGLLVAILCDRTRLRLVTGIAILMAVATVAVIFVGIGIGKTGDLIMVGFAGFGIIGGLSLLDALAAQSYPSHLRSTGVGAMLGVGRVGSIVGPPMIGWILGLTGGSTGPVFIAIAGATTIGLITMLLLTRKRGNEAGGPDRDALESALLTSEKQTVPLPNLERGSA